MELRSAATAGLPAAVGRLVLFARFGAGDQDAPLRDRVLLQRDTLLLRLLGVVLAAADIDVVGDLLDRGRLRSDHAEVAVHLLAELPGTARGLVRGVALRERGRRRRHRGEREAAQEGRDESAVD